MIKHKHHIIPKHMGGTDDPSNIVELTIEEHAEQHRLLYEKCGKKEDYLAWQGLSKMMSKQEILKKVIKNCSKKGGEATRKKYKGSFWCYHPETKEVKRLHELPEGWVKGFLPTIGRPAKKFFGEKNGMYGKSAVEGFKWYTNGVESYYGEPGTQPDGYYQGRPKKLKQNLSEKKKGKKSFGGHKSKRWYTNGIDNYLGYEGTEPEGYKLGRSKWVKE